MLHVAHVLIENIKGIERLEFRPGAITVIAGRNQCGKTSVLDAIRTLFDGGHDPSLIRKGEKAGKITMILSDGTTIIKSITENTSRLAVFQPDGQRVDGGDKTYLDSLANALAVDPAKLLKADVKPKDIAKVLLHALNIQFSRADLLAAIGRQYDAPTDQESYSLADIEQLRASIYENRRRLNVTIRDKEGTINDLRKALPAESPEDVRAAIAKTKEELADTEKLARDELAAANEQEKAELEAMRNEYDRRMREVEAWKAKTWCEIEQKFKDARNEIESRLRPKRDEVVAKLSAQEEQLQVWARAKAIDDQIAKHIDELRSAQDRSSQLTKIMEQLDKLKQERLGRLPVPGLTYEDDMFYVHGVPWHHVNTAKRTEYACAIAALRAGPLRMLCLDDAEHLDSDGQAALQKWAEQNNFQLIAAMVDDCNLEISS